MTQNTFKNEIDPTQGFIEEDVVITEQEMAIYRYVALKIAYKQDQAQKVIDEIRYKRIEKAMRLNNVVTRGFAAAVIIAVVSLIIKHGL